MKSKTHFRHDRVGSLAGLARFRDFGERLARLRAERAVSVAEMARRLGVSRDTVYKIERGNVSVAMGTVIRYLDTLGIDGAGGLADMVRSAQDSDVVASRVSNSMFPPDVVRQAVVKFRA